MPGATSGSAVRRRWRIVEYVLVTCLVAWAASAVAPAKPFATDKGSTQVADLVSFYIAGRIAVQDGPGKIYDLPLQKKRMSDVVGVTLTDILPYLYPPHSLIFYAPLASFSPEQAYRIWIGINVLCTVLLIALLYVAGICTAPGSLLLAAFFTVAYVPWLTTIVLGQPVIVMAAGLLGGYLLAQRHKPLLAGIVLVMTVFKPQLAIIPMLYMLIIFGKPLWYSVVGTAIALVAVDCAIFGVSIWPAYAHTLLYAPYTLHGFEPTHLIMGNARALALLLLGERHFGAINTASLCLWLACVIAAACIAQTAKRKTQEYKDLGFGLVLALGCISSPYLFVNSLVLLVIPAAYAVHYHGRKTLYPLACALIIFLGAFSHQEINPFLWVPAQCALIGWIGYQMAKKPLAKVN